MDRPFEEVATDDPSSRQGRVHGRGQDDQVALEDEIVRALPDEDVHYWGGNRIDCKPRANNGLLGGGKVVSRGGC